MSHVLFNTWQLLMSKDSGDLGHATLNKNHFEQSNGNDSSLIIFECVPLCSVTVICVVNNVKSSDKKGRGRSADTETQIQEVEG